MPTATRAGRRERPRDRTRGSTHGRRAREHEISRWRAVIIASQIRGCMPPTLARGRWSYKRLSAPNSRRPPTPPGGGRIVRPPRFGGGERGACLGEPAASDLPGAVVESPV